MPTATQTAATGLHQIPVSELRPLPGAIPAHIRSREQIAELAASIRKHGVLEPLIVRPARHTYVLQRGRLARSSSVFGWFVVDASLSGRDWKYRGRSPAFYATRKEALAALPADVPWEVVRGLGRLLAARKAGIRLVPCLARELTDAEAGIIRAG